MIDSSVYFYVALAAAAFYAASIVVGGRFGRARAGRTTGGRARSGRRSAGRRAGGRRGRLASWSLNSAILFAGGFGVGGFFASAAGLGELAATGVAIALGVAFAALDAAVLGALERRQGSSALSLADYVGRSATVEISIAQGGVGRIRCSGGGETVHLLARSAGGSIPINATVHVTAVEGSVVLVEPEGGRAPDSHLWRQ